MRIVVFTLFTLLATMANAASIVNLDRQPRTLIITNGGEAHQEILPYGRRTVETGPNVYFELADPSNAPKKQRWITTTNGQTGAIWARGNDEYAIEKGRIEIMRINDESMGAHR